MSARLQNTFSDLQMRGRKALVASFYIGDPTLEESLDLAMAAADAGADILELALPFSDPYADGPTLVLAGQRALAAGARPRRCFDAIAQLRETITLPFMLFSYYNPVAVIGEDRFVALAVSAGVDCMLIGDLLPENAGGLRRTAGASGVDLVPLVAPTDDLSRLDFISNATRDPTDGTRGFVYFVSTSGVTGSQLSQWSHMKRQIEGVRRRFDIPVVVGFGIDRASRARAVVDQGADGVVVGSAIARRIERGGTASERRSGVRDLIRELRIAI